VRSPHTRQAYEYALEQFFVWAAGRAISRQSVQGYGTWLGEMKFSPSTINQRLAAIRKLASEAQRCGYVDSETAQAIVTVAGVSQKGRRLGRWLAWEEARTLLQAPNPHSIRGMRDRALLGVLVTCALRRGELSRMNCEHLAMRDGRWVFLDFLGKGNKTRSVAVPLWVKQEIDGWLDVAGIEKGPIFRRVLANGRVGKDALTERAAWQLVREYAQQVGIGTLAPHDLRRYAESEIMPNRDF
jgi:site-specific recombinase XerD